MVRFGGYALRHVRMWQVQDSRVIHDRLIPNASVGYRGDETAGGRTIRVAGEIRHDSDHVLRTEGLRVRQDDVARTLDPEDRIDPPISSVTFYETS